MLDLVALERRLRADPVLASLPHRESHSIRFVLGPDDFLVEVGASLIVREVSDLSDRWAVSLTIPAEELAAALSNPPPPGATSVQALVARLGDGAVGGDRRRWAQYAPVIERVVDALREESVRPQTARWPHQSEIVGRYVNLRVDGETYRVYYEAAGAGIPLVCLHTAGGDARQYHHILDDAEITSRYQVVAFDLPWHGRSNPPSDWRSIEYELRTTWYAAVVRAFCRALDLRSPVLLGCSMGGVIGLYLASVHGDEFRAVLSLAGALEVRGRSVAWTRHIEVDHSLFVMEWMTGLFAPSSPPELRDQVLWQFAQAAPGVYSGDISYLVQDPVLRGLGPATCPLYLFSGAYDYSATPAAIEAAAHQLGGKLITMESAGHFPVCEDPVEFRSYLTPVLEEIVGGST